MNRLLPVTIVFSLLLGGCALLDFKQASKTPATDPSEQVAQLEKEGRFGEAVALLSSAIDQGLSNQKNQDKLHELKQSKAIHDQRIYDELLIEEVTYLKRQLPLMEMLSRANPTDADITHQLAIIRTKLEIKQSALSVCGWRNKDAIDLAKACLSLSLTLKNDSHDRTKLEMLLAKEKQDKKKKAEKAHAAREAVWKKRNLSRMQEAKAYYRTNRLQEARALLAQVLEEDPKNRSAKQLLKQVDASLESYLSNLLKAGDRLYREGEIEAARLTWQAAENLSPGDARVTEKLERASRVMENLDSLRNQQ